MNRAASASLLCVLLLLAACSSGESMASAEAAVDTFRGSMNGERFDEIYNGSGKEFKDSLSPEKAREFFSSIHRKLGAAKSPQKTGWKVNYGTNGKLVILSYHTTFDRGAGDETFTFRIKDGKATLLGYYINSNELILN